MPITFYPAGLNIGTYTDTFVVTSSASNSPLNIPVTFNIVESSVTLIADPPSLTVTSPVNGPDITQTINFTSSSSSTPVDITNVTDDATPWDFGSWSPGPTPSSMPITFYPAGLNIGTYTDTFVVTSSASNSPLNIPVTFNIVESSVTLIADPPSLTVTSPVNGPDITQTINFTSSSSSTPVDITNVTDDATPWDFGSWSPGPTPSSMPITFYPAGLNIGTYTDTFVVTSSASNSPLNIPVTFNIVESSVTLIADPPSLTVTSPVNGPDITQTINFTSSSSSTPVDITNVTDDATPWDFGSWSPGPTPSSMPIIFYPAGLNIGTYTDTFVVTSSA